MRRREKRREGKCHSSLVCINTHNRHVSPFLPPCTQPTERPTRRPTKSPTPKPTEWSGDAWSTTPSPTKWNGDGHVLRSYNEETSNDPYGCDERDQDECCDQDSSKRSWDERKEVCGSMGCSIKKCLKRDGGGKGYGGNGDGKGYGYEGGGGGYGVETSEGTSGDGYGGGYGHNDDETSGDGYGYEDKTSGDGYGHGSEDDCDDDELEVCCGQDSSRHSFADRKEVCGYLGCSIKKCVKGKYGGGYGYGGDKNSRGGYGDETSGDGDGYEKTSGDGGGYGGKTDGGYGGGYTPATSNPTKRPTGGYGYGNSEPSYDNPTKRPTKRPTGGSGYGAAPSGHGYGNASTPRPTRRPTGGGYGSDSKPTIVHDLKALFDNDSADDVPTSSRGGFVPDISHFKETEEVECEETNGANECVEVCTTTKKIFEGDVELDETVTVRRRACGGGMTAKQMRKQGSN